MNKITKLPPPNENMPYRPNGGLDKAVMIGCILLFIAFIISLPFMIRDKQRLEAQQWHDNGCHMYDDYVKNVPAKCQAYFIDHYQAQKARLQPPDEN